MPSGATTTPASPATKASPPKTSSPTRTPCLHDPEYRESYAVDLLREFPRLPLYHDFDVWKRMGQELLDLHIGFESVQLYDLQRVDNDSNPGKATLRADKERGNIVLDGQTTLTGVPAEAWEYRLGSRSALEWVLDQYKEKTPRDPTIRERFNTYRFADHKERVIDLLQRVCAVSVETVRIVDELDRITEIDPDEGWVLTDEAREELERRQAQAANEPTYTTEELRRGTGAGRGMLRRMRSPAP